ncbi:FadR/GntR family transcriptional regulator [Alterinioella nitratireducens]|uniref:FadR/GntR family transcriptional regulator n=1 Tax=Alterinioella nitratireducens TaxID=2735915 RepID=UPI00155542AE|nr:FadR/GntR family transcriptional regulator [Alterinioella nitratireducens]NPD21490.1 FadR family transcriptional regulator [Alterinioella nitratireducens]
MDRRPEHTASSAETPHRFEGGVRSLELAEVLEAKILQGSMAVGESLPAERDMMILYNVSRTTVREALRILGAKGLIEVRRGRRGGSYVQAPNGESISRSLDLFIQGHDIRFSDLLAVREAIEPMAAAQAAQQRTDEDIARHYEILDQADHTIADITRFSQLNIDWHMAVVRASHNPLFLSFMTSISSALFLATEREEFDPEIRSIVARAHRRITDAIAEGDVDAARRRMTRHVTSYGERLDPTRSQTSRILR